MKLYWFDTVNPRKACATAKYLQSPVEFVHVDLGRGAHRRPEYLALNPNGKVPTLIDGTRGFRSVAAGRPPDRGDPLAELGSRALLSQRFQLVFRTHHQAALRLGRHRSG